MDTVLTLTNKNMSSNDPKEKYQEIPWKKKSTHKCVPSKVKSGNSGGLPVRYLKYSARLSRENLKMHSHRIYGNMYNDYQGKLI